MGIFSDLFGSSKSSAKRGLFASLFGTSKAESRLESITARDKADAVTSRASRVLDEAIPQNRLKGDAESRLDALLRGDRKALEDLTKRKEEEKRTETFTEKPLGGRPQGGSKWIPAASSFVDAFYFEPDAPGAFQGKLYVRFTTKSGAPGQEGFYTSNLDEYDDLFTAASKGEDIWDQFIRPGRTYTRTGKGALIGTRLPWPRRGSRASKLPQKSSGRWWSRTGRIERG